ncbi:MAG: hypothetical protein Q7S09_05595 [bacterium]|nr:hypothetical protein [bacterium]
MKKFLKHRTRFLAGIVFYAMLMQPIALRASDGVLTGAEETPAGSSISISSVSGISFYFPSVSRAGITTVVREISAEKYPNIDFGSPAYVYRASTTAQFSGPITVCVSFDMERFSVPNGEVRLWQLDGTEAAPITHTYGWTYACGNTNHLSSFVAAQNFGVAPVTFFSAGNRNAAASFSSMNAAVSLQSGSSSQVSRDPHVSRVHFFSAQGSATLTITNGSSPITGARILLNGSVVGNGSLFKKHQNELSSPVSLLPGTNTIEVFVDGGPGSSFTLSIQRTP